MSCHQRRLHHMALARHVSNDELMGACRVRQCTSLRMPGCHLAWLISTWPRPQCGLPRPLCGCHLSSSQMWLRPRSTPSTISSGRLSNSGPRPLSARTGSSPLCQPPPLPDLATCRVSPAESRHPAGVLATSNARWQCQELTLCCMSFSPRAQFCCHLTMRKDP